MRDHFSNIVLIAAVSGAIVLYSTLLLGICMDLSS